MTTIRTTIRTMTLGDYDRWKTRSDRDDGPDEEWEEDREEEPPEPEENENQ